jgi:hypothetical protein
MDIYDCSCKSILPINLEGGNYKIEAEKFQRKRVKKYFTKKRYTMTLDIEF